MGGQTVPIRCCTRATGKAPRHITKERRVSLYLDVFKCPKNHTRSVFRQTRSIGKKVATYCTACNKMYKILANEPKRRGD